MTELRSKEGLMAELTGERTVLTERVEELEGQVEELSSSLLQKDKDVEVRSDVPHAPVSELTVSVASDECPPHSLCLFSFSE